MKPNSTLAYLLCLSALSFASASSAAAAEQDSGNAVAKPAAAATAPSSGKPNLVVFLTDDHSVLDSTVYGSADVRTPNMQRLATRGLTFDSAFVASPSCAPSRAALLTGLMPARNGAEANHSRPRAEIKKLPAYFQELGYEVVAFGKVGHYAQTAEYRFDSAENFGYHEDVAVPNGVKWLRERKSDKPLCFFSKPGRRRRRPTRAWRLFSGVTTFGPRKNCTTSRPIPTS